MLKQFVIADQGNFYTPPPPACAPQAPGRTAGVARGRPDCRRILETLALETLAKVGAAGVVTGAGHAVAA